jgi:hypothetical protein
MVKVHRHPIEAGSGVNKINTRKWKVRRRRISVQRLDEIRLMKHSNKEIGRTNAIFRTAMYLLVTILTHAKVWIVYHFGPVDVFIVICTWVLHGDWRTVSSIQVWNKPCTKTSTINTETLLIHLCYELLFITITLFKSVNVIISQMVGINYGYI